jgi:glycosyltransferase involved in cell wall biosynthesis
MRIKNMKLLFITAHPYLPQMRGGAQNTADTLIKRLISNGHNVSVLCGLMKGGIIEKIGRPILKIKKILSLGNSVKDKSCGYNVYRAWFSWEALQEVVNKEKSDLIVVLSGLPIKMAVEAEKLNIPIIVMLQNVEFDNHGEDITKLSSNTTYVSNSKFTQKKYKDKYNIDSIVINPLIDQNKFLIKTSRELVVFINPHPSKGLSIATKLAQDNPEIPFLFVESWPLSKDQSDELNHQISNTPNISFMRVVPDMREVYKKAKVLLVPSMWEEAFGRVAVEAQINGIPVIASNKGGLPEAVGPGGILLDTEDTIVNWSQALRNLWYNDQLYNDIANKAKVYSARPEMNVDLQMLSWEEILETRKNGFRNADKLKNCE